jgi:hypothetical protein
MPEDSVLHKLQISLASDVGSLKPVFVMLNLPGLSQSVTAFRRFVNKYIRGVASTWTHRLGVYCATEVSKYLLLLKLNSIV